MPSPLLLARSLVLPEPREHALIPAEAPLDVAMRLLESGGGRSQAAKGNILVLVLYAIDGSQVIALCNTGGGEEVLSSWHDIQWDCFNQFPKRKGELDTKDTDLEELEQLSTILSPESLKALRETGWMATFHCQMVRLKDGHTPVLKAAGVGTLSLGFSLGRVFQRKRAGHLGLVLNLILCADAGLVNLRMTQNMQWFQNQCTYYELPEQETPLEDAAHPDRWRPIDDDWSDDTDHCDGPSTALAIMDEPAHAEPVLTLAMPEDYLQHQEEGESVAATADAEEFPPGWMLLPPLMPEEEDDEPRRVPRHPRVPPMDMAAKPSVPMPARGRSRSGGRSRIGAAQRSGTRPAKPTARPSSAAGHSVPPRPSSAADRRRERRGTRSPARRGAQHQEEYEEEEEAGGPSYLAARQAAKAAAADGSDDGWEPETEWRAPEAPGHRGSHANRRKGKISKGKGEGTGKISKGKGEGGKATPDISKGKGGEKKRRRRQDNVS